MTNRADVNVTSSGLAMAPGRGSKVASEVPFLPP